MYSLHKKAAIKENYNNFVIELGEVWTINIWHEIKPS